MLGAYDALVTLVRQRLSDLSPAAALVLMAPLLEAAPAAEPSRRLWHRVLAPRRPAVPEGLAPLLARLAPPPGDDTGAGTPSFVPRRLMAALSAEKERRQRAAASPGKPPPARAPSPPPEKEQVRRAVRLAGPAQWVVRLVMGSGVVCVEVGCVLDAVLFGPYCLSLPGFGLALFFLGFLVHL